MKSVNIIKDDNFKVDEAILELARQMKRIADALNEDINIRRKALKSQEEMARRLSIKKLVFGRER